MRVAYVSYLYLEVTGHLAPLSTAQFTRVSSILTCICYKNARFFLKIKNKQSYGACSHLHCASQ